MYLANAMNSDDMIDWSIFTVSLNVVYFFGIISDYCRENPDYYFLEW